MNCQYTRNIMELNTTLRIATCTITLCEHRGHKTRDTAINSPGLLLASRNAARALHRRDLCITQRHCVVSVTAVFSLRSARIRDFSVTQHPDVISFIVIFLVVTQFCWFLSHSRWQVGFRHHCLTPSQPLLQPSRNATNFLHNPFFWCRATLLVFLTRM